MSNETIAVSAELKQKLLSQLRNIVKATTYRIVDKSSASKPCYLLYRNSTGFGSGVLIFKRGNLRRFVSDVKKHLNVTEQQWANAEPPTNLGQTSARVTSASPMWWQNGQYE